MSLECLARFSSSSGTEEFCALNSGDRSREGGTSDGATSPTPKEQSPASSAAASTISQALLDCQVSFSVFASTIVSFRQTSESLAADLVIVMVFQNELVPDNCLLRQLHPLPRTG